MSKEQGSCPKCGDELTYRAGEWSCTGCDWFVLGGPEAPPNPQPPAASGGSEEYYATPAQPHSRPVGRPLDRRRDRLRIEKHIFLAIFTGWVIGVTIYWLYQLAAAQLHDPNMIHLTFAVLGGLGLGTTAALVLYIDWNLPKQAGTILLLLGLGLAAYYLHLEWSEIEPLVRTMSIITLAFIPWYVVLLFRDMRKHRVE